MLELANPPVTPMVVGSILSADFGFMIDDCRDVLAKGADLLHVDVMDGHFVANLTMGADMIRALRRHLPQVFIDVHLMVERPGDYVEAFAKAGANHFTFHFELTTASQADGEGDSKGGGNGNDIDAAGLIQRIHDQGMTAGLAVNPPTDERTLAHGLGPLLDRIDLALIMSVNPGRSGQAFMDEVLGKARWVRQHADPRVRVEMDGGLDPTTSKRAVDAGVDMLVSASALFGAEDRQAVIAAMHDAS